MWQNNYMKERFWFVYYWIMIVLASVLPIVIIDEILTGGADRLLKIIPEGFIWITFSVSLLMTIIRWILTGKHIWQKP